MVEVVAALVWDKDKGTSKNCSKITPNMIGVIF